MALLAKAPFPRKQRRSAIMGVAQNAIPIARGAHRTWSKAPSTDMVTLSVATPLLEEPDALIAHVRVCGGLGGQPPGLPGKGDSYMRVFA